MESYTDSEIEKCASLVLFLYLIMTICLLCIVDRDPEDDDNEDDAID